MAQPYSSTREYINKIFHDYEQYVALYMLCNNGSKEGVTPFDVFYWRQIYVYKHEVNS